MSEAAALRDGITVVVRTLGRATLHQALASVQVQGRDDVEIVIVDAAGSGAMPTTTQPEPRWLSRGAPLHRCDAAQAGLDAVATRWALFLDDDDWLLESHLDKLAAALAANPEAIVAHTGVETVRFGPDDAVGEVLGRFDEAFEPWELLPGNRIPIHAALFDVQRARAGGAAFDRSLDVYEDWDFWLQLALLGRFVHVGGVSARYRVHADASQVHRLQHGDAPFWRVWRKWWSRAPEAWWNQVLYQREVAVVTKGELRGVRAERDARTEALAQLSTQFDATVAELRRSEARLAAESERLAAESRRLFDTERRLAEREFELHAETERARQTEAHLAAQLAYRDELVRTLRELYAAVDVQRRRQLDAISALESSASWRVTAPLRSAEDKLQALRGRAGAWRRRLGWTPGVAEYRRWMAEVEEPAMAERRAAIAPMLGAGRPLISVLMPVCDPHQAWLDEAIASLQAQWWPHWQLCIADDASVAAGVREHLRAWASREPRITLVERVSRGHISAATNEALAVARGDWVALMDQDDRLAPHALAEVALAVHADHEAELVYSDEDKLDHHGRRCEPHFKPDFCVERLRGQNFVSHLTALRRERVVVLGGLREGFEGAQDHELLLRATEGLAPQQVHHIPQVLYHWRAAAGSTALASASKAYALHAALRAVNDSLQRCELGAAAEGLPRRHWLRVRYPVPQPRPAVGGVDGPFGGEQPVQWWLAAALQPRGEGWFDEMLSLLLRPGVGLVGGAVVDAQGRLLDGARELGDNEQWELIGAGFGARLMVQQAENLAPGCWLMRREVFERWQAAGGAAALSSARAAADFIESLAEDRWRTLWTPFAPFSGRGR